MSSLRQIEANRRNSQSSTGPRSPEGKATSRLNALKSGIHAQSQIIPGEDAGELESLARGYHEQFQPATPLQCFLVDALIHADWQLRRLHRVEAQVWTHQISETTGNAEVGQVYLRALDAFGRLQRRIDATERSYYRALKQLQQLAQSAEDATQMLSPANPESVEDALDLPELASFRQLPPTSPARAPVPSRP